jgi:hypothetical protein
MNTCSECGKPIALGSPGGFCSACLLRLGLREVESEAEVEGRWLGEVQSAECNVQKEGEAKDKGQSAGEKLEQEGREGEPGKL